MIQYKFFVSKIIIDNSIFNDYTCYNNLVLLQIYNSKGDNVFEINKNSSVPIYVQLADYIKKSIDNGDLLENDKIQSENELCASYDISRTTVRQALKILHNEGYIYKVRGKGSYVSSSKIYQNRSTFSKFYDDIKNLGKTPKSKILSLKVVTPSTSVREKMKLDDKDKVCEIVWVRYSDDQPLIYETINLNYKLMVGIEKEPLQEMKLYDIITKKYNIKLTHGNEQFMPCKISKLKAEYLNCSTGDLGMNVTRTVYQHDQVIEYTNSTVLGDKFIYTVNF